MQSAIARSMAHIFFLWWSGGDAERANLCRPGRKKILAPIAAFLLFFFSLPMKAQLAGGSIAGAVTGESGAAMPDVRISVKDVSTGLARAASTNTAGLYSVPGV